MDENRLLLDENLLAPLVSGSETLTGSLVSSVFESYRLLFLIPLYLKSTH